MPSLSSQWKAAKAAWDDDESNLSPGTRFGLMFDPLAYIGGDKYRNFINKTGDQANLSLSKALGTDDRGGWSANKPASTIGLMAAAYYGGGAAMGGMGGGASGGGMFGNMFGGGGGSNLGIFSNGGKAGLGAGFGGGNAGALAQAGGISGGAGMGSVAGGGGLSNMGMQDWMKLGQQMPGMQQPQQQQGPKPYLYRGKVIWM